MEYEDRIAVPTPEGIVLDYTLAGIGSRFIAGTIDLALKLLLLAAALLVIGILTTGSIGVIIFALVGFLLLFGYDIVFEVWAAGRTPGKRWNGLRVVMAGGRPIGFSASAARNLLRLIDSIPLVYVVGGASILLTSRNQRLGDIAAGAIVVREPTAKHGVPAVEDTDQAPLDSTVAVDVTAVSAAELSAVRDFLARRSELAPEARSRVATRLADSLEAKIGGLPAGGLQPEPMLETIAAAKRTPPAGPR